jgi:4-azaleucine resistance transporter AzlC
MVGSRRCGGAWQAVAMNRPDADTTPTPSASFRAGAIAVSPVLLGIVPFGLVAGVAATEAGLGLAEAVGFSMGIFAGASQLAALELLGTGAPAWVAIMTAAVINLRMAMYSASIASYMTDQSIARRWVASYLLTDQAYALSVARYQQEGVAKPAVGRFWFLLGTALVVWSVWQITTVLGEVVGGAVPEAVPLGFAVPRTFLVLLVPAVTDRPTLAAALVGGGVALVAAPLPANLGMPLGAVTGVTVGYALVRRRSA